MSDVCLPTIYTAQTYLFSFISLIRTQDLLFSAFHVLSYEMHCVSHGAAEYCTVLYEMIQGD